MTDQRVRPHLSDSQATMTERLLTLNLTTPRDVLVVNEGSWFYRHDGPEAGSPQPHAARPTNDAQKLLATLRARQSQGRRTPRVFWRETLAQHFDTPAALIVC